jgi:cytochrome c-type biogenesis protein CcmE
MAENTWEKPRVTDLPPGKLPQGKSRSEYLKFAVGGLLMLAAVVYLIISGTANGARYFITIHELVNNPDYVGKTVRVSGAVVGSTIVYDSQHLTIDFTVADIPEDTTDLARILHEAVLNPSAKRMNVHIENQVMPDLLKDEAQAILTGTIGPDGTFNATELLLKCPSRYQENVPSQAQVGA